MLYRLLFTCILIILLCVAVCAQIPTTTPLMVNHTRLDLGIVNRSETTATVHYRLTGRNLAASVTVIAPLGVEVCSTTPHGQWRKSMMLDLSAQGNVDTIVYVRLDNSLPLLVQSGLRHFVGETEANIRLDVIGIVREKPVIRTTADALEYAGHGLPIYIENIQRVGNVLIALQNGYSPSHISNNEGESWTRIKTPISNMSSPIIFSAQRNVQSTTEMALYAFAVSSKASILALYRSDDDGISWNEITTNLPFSINNNVRSVWTQGRIWIAIGNDQLLYRSPDNGFTWQRINDKILSNKYIRGFVQPLGNHILLNVDSISGSYLLRSQDTGRTWEQFTTIPRLNQGDNYKLYSNGNVCLLQRGWDIFRLRKDASGWDSLVQFSRLGIYDFEGYFLGVDNNQATIYKSIDGVNWQQAGKVPYRRDGVYYSFRNMKSSNGSLVAVADGDILRSLDNGNTWHLAISGFRSPITPPYFIQKNKISWIPYFTTYSASGTSSFWEFNLKAYPNEEDRSNGLRMGNILLRGITGGIARSVDSGRTEQIIISGFVPNVSISSLCNVNGDVFASGLNSIYRSSDSGATWKNVSKNLKVNANIKGLINVGSMVFAFDQNEGIYRSNSLIESWEHIGVLETRPFYPIKFQGVESLVASSTRLFMTSGRNIYQSDDLGTTWQLFLQDKINDTTYYAVGYRAPWLYVNRFITYNEQGLHRLALPPEPELSISPPALHFRVAANNPSKPTQTIRVVNSGSAAGEIRSINFSQPEDFEVLSSPPSRIESEDSVELAIRFRSKRPGVTSSTITFFIGNPFNSSTSALICRISSEVSADAPLNTSQIGISSTIAMGDVLPFPAQNEAILYYTLIEDTTLTLDMFDMQGNVIRRFANGMQPKGTQRVEINTTALSNGAYMIVLRSRFGAIQRWLVVAK